MKHQKLLSLVLSLILATSLLAACVRGAPTATPTPESTATPTPTDTSSSTATATPHMIMDTSCFMTIRAIAWVDVNADGVQDTGEPPFPGVRFRKAGEYIGGEISDENGYVNVEFVTSGDLIPYESYLHGEGHLSCDLATDRVYATGVLKNGRQFAVEPEIPSGYRLTTSGETYEFGFAPLNLTTTPIP